LFNFEIRHIPGTKHITINNLSRRPRTALDNINKMHEKDIDNFIIIKLNILNIQPILIADESVINENHQQVLSNQYFKNSQAIANYLITLRRPEGLSRFKFR
jgi:hypothetical protein